MTLNQAWKRFETHSALHLRPRTLANRRSIFRQLCAELGKVELAKITTTRLEAYASKRRESVSAVSVNNELRAFGFLRTWAKANRLKVGPVPPRLRELVPFRVKAWTPEEVDRLFVGVGKESPAIAELVFALAHTGLRCGEALALKWENVDLGRRLIFVRPSKEWTSKNGKPREVPIGDGLLERLRALPRLGAYVFPSSKGERFARWPQRQFDRARKAAGLAGGPHTLRHTYATEFLAQGRPIEALAQILGHSDETTTRLYAHLRPEHLAAHRNVVSFGRRRRRASHQVARAIYSVCLAAARNALSAFRELIDT